MRPLFLIILLANLAVLGFGQGLFGPPPSEDGRTPRRLSERQQNSIALGNPLPAEPAPAPVQSK